MRILIETGTYEGEMVEAMQKRFRVIHSIEIFEPLYRKALEKFSGIDHIHLHHGDSGNCLSEIFDTVNEPALFRLDAHYPGGGGNRQRKYGYADPEGDKVHLRSPLPGSRHPDR